MKSNNFCCHHHDMSMILTWFSYRIELYGTIFNPMGSYPTELHPCKTRSGTGEQVSSKCRFCRCVVG
jgi:hypothetical protein